LGSHGPVACGARSYAIPISMGEPSRYRSEMALLSQRSR
jgi:hypothetical protein